MATSSESTHQHQGKTCPVTKEDHGFCPAQDGDRRSVCPALNTMANHGYISRDGKNLSAYDLVRGLKNCYGLSAPLAYLLSFGGFLMLHTFGRRISLHEINKHNAIEHNASLVHHDTPEGQKFAPIEIDPQLVDALCADVRPSAKEVESRSSSQIDERMLMNFEDVARARVRRENECGHVTAFQQEIARGEMAIILGVWEVPTKTKTGIPLEYLMRWIGDERMPEGWRPDHAQGLLDVVKRSRTIKKASEKMKNKENQDAKGSM